MFISLLCFTSWVNVVDEYEYMNCHGWFIAKCNASVWSMFNPSTDEICKHGRGVGYGVSMNQ